MVDQDKLDVLRSKDMLIEYKKTLPSEIKIQLRFPSKTSARRTYGVCTIVWDKDEDCVVIVPYVHKRKIISEDEEIEPHDETVTILTKVCLLAETGLDTDVLAMQIGTVHMGQNTSPEREKKSFPKFTMLVTNYKGVLRSAPEEILSDKNFKPVWVKRHLLKTIFEEVFVDENGTMHAHSQKYAYERFCEYWDLEL